MRICPGCSKPGDATQFEGVPPSLRPSFEVIPPERGRPALEHWNLAEPFGGNVVLDQLPNAEVVDVVLRADLKRELGGVRGS